MMFVQQNLSLVFVESKTNRIIKIIDILVEVFDYDGVFGLTLFIC